MTLSVTRWSVTAPILRQPSTAGAAAVGAGPRSDGALPPRGLPPWAPPVGFPSPLTLQAPAARSLHLNADLAHLGDRWSGGGS